MRHTLQAAARQWLDLELFRAEAEAQLPYIIPTNINSISVSINHIIYHIYLFLLELEVSVHIGSGSICEHGLLILISSG